PHLPAVVAPGSSLPAGRLSKSDGPGVTGQATDAGKGPESPRNGDVKAVDGAGWPRGDHPGCRATTPAGSSVLFPEILARRKPEWGAGIRPLKAPGHRSCTARSQGPRGDPCGSPFR